MKAWRSVATNRTRSGWADQYLLSDGQITEDCSAAFRGTEDEVQEACDRFGRNNPGEVEFIPQT
jgi:hypothetical protein